MTVPEATRRQFPRFDAALRRYGNQFYWIAHVPPDDARRDLAYTIVQAFFDLYAHERNWATYKGAEGEALALVDALRADLFPPVTEDQV